MKCDLGFCFVCYYDQLGNPPHCFVLTIHKICNLRACQDVPVELFYWLGKNVFFVKLRNRKIPF